MCTTCAAASRHGRPRSSRQCRRTDHQRTTPDVFGMRNRRARRIHFSGSTPMRRRLFAYALPASLALAGIAGTAAAEDLIQIYREALANDPVLSSARATWVATQEAVPQARAALLPSVNLAASA